MKKSLKKISLKKKRGFKRKDSKRTSKERNSPKGGSSISDRLMEYSRYRKGKLGNGPSP